MSDRAKLPVFDVLADAVKLTFWRIPAILKVTLSSALVTLFPAFVLLVVVLLLVDPGSEFLEQTSESEFISSGAPYAMLINGSLIAVYLFAFIWQSMIITALVRMAALGERVRLFNFNRYMWAGIGSQIVLVLFQFALFVFLLLGLAIFAVGRPDEGTLTNGIVAATAFFILLQIYLSIRMTLLYPDAMITGVIRPWAAFRMTRSSFWRLLAILILALVITLVLSIADAFTVPIFSWLPGFDAPLWTVPAGSMLADSFVADLVHGMLQYPLLVVGILISLAVQLFLSGFAYVISGLIYRNRNKAS